MMADENAGDAGARLAGAAPAAAGRGRAPHDPLRRRLSAVLRRAGGGLLLLRRRRPPHPRLHLGPDVRDPRPQPSGRGRRDPAQLRAGDPPVQLDPRARGRRAVPRARRAPAAAAAEGDPAQHRQRGERGRDPHGQARDRRARGGRAERVLPRPDRRRRGRDLLGRTARLWPRDPGQHGDTGAQRLSLPDPPLHGRVRSVLPRGRLRADRQPALRPARRRDRRADPLDRRRDRAAAGLLSAPERALRGARHAADPGRGADRVRAGRRQLRLRAGRRGAGLPHRCPRRWAAGCRSPRR